MTDELSVTAKQTKRSLYIMKISKKVAKMQNAESLAKYQDEQNKNEHFAAYNKETDKAKKVKMLAEAVKEGWL